MRLVDWKSGRELCRQQGGSPPPALLWWPSTRSWPTHHLPTTCPPFGCRFAPICRTPPILVRSWVYVAPPPHHTFSFQRIPYATGRVEHSPSLRPQPAPNRYMPASKGAHTALFMCRISRQPGGAWLLNTIGECDHTARDFGSLVPEIKSYMTDLVPSIQAPHALLLCPPCLLTVGVPHGYCTHRPTPLGLPWNRLL